MDKRLNPASPTAPHIIDARQFSRDWIEGTLFPLALDLQETPVGDLPRTLLGKRLFYLFYEPSTRTRISFETAVALLGGAAAGMEHHELLPEDESLEDRIRVINQYGYDFILLRYHEQGGAQRAAAVSQTPIISGGDGQGQHPTQALLDTYTIWRELGRLDDFKVALVGDLSYERTTNSLASLLPRFQNVTLYFVSPHLLRIGVPLRTYLEQNRVRFHEVRDLRTIVDEVDVLYITRAHSERLEHARRFENPSPPYALDADLMARLPAHATVLHPLPRGPELPPDFDSDPRIACFRQTRNGLFIRMALLCLLATTKDEDQSLSGPHRRRSSARGR